ncbi:VWA domain-containing protein [Micromonospora sp. NPDC048935]|uniref:vWA domain-containing protein n=1 Tax=Micromonospora sp. NPDC048935 TaxID=3364262 RepID=UPI0037219629
MPDQGILLPFYLVVDVSWSMKGDKLDAAREILPAVANTLAKNPILNDKVRFSLIDFADEAQVLVPLCDLSQQGTLPSLELRGGTSYAEAFRTLREQIFRDVTQLRGDGYRVHRPAVFFISDGEPLDDWQDAFSALTEYNRETGTGFRWYPVLVPCGVDTADRDVLRKLVYPQQKSKLYMMRTGADAAGAIRAMTEVLISSVLASGQSIAAGGSGLILPGPGDVPADLDVEDDWLD